MNAAVISLSVMLALASLAGGAAKLAGAPPMRRDAQRFGLSLPAYRLIGVSEIAAAAGLLLGLLWWPIGAAASAGLVCLMTGAVTAHRRAGDPPAKTTGPLAIAALAIATAAIQSAT
ncbi:DoxX family protein [Actinomadura sp. NPDC049753]|uniref:DoxX family protein n=1 Tax=Actinomadura sp. NPDC049753 TaxID=3154739 RepID=UPI003417D26D